MALRAVPDHPKFLYLKSLLKLSKYATLGCLESLWHFAGRYTPHGNIGKYSDQEIERWIEWDGEPGFLIATLIEAGWIDHDTTHRLLIHDWRIHSDNATKAAVRRSKIPFITPDIPDKSIISNVSLRSSRLQRPPEPEPVPEPAPKTTTTAPLQRRGDDPDPIGTPVETLLAAHAGEEPNADGSAHGKKQRIAGSNRGCRLPDDFAVTEEHRAFAAKNGFRSPDEIIDEFRDYWIAVPGSKGMKLNWDATFRNRMREFPMRRNANGGFTNGKHGENRPSPAKQRIDGARSVLAKIAVDRGLVDLDRFDGGVGTPISSAGLGGKH